MAQLSTIISSILRDMIVAQHEANMYAISLEDVYKQNGRLEQFALPTVAVGEVELDLRYGVKSDSAQTEQYEINYPLLRKVAKQISIDLAKAIIKSTLPVLQSLFPEDGTDSGTKVLANFAIDDNLKRKYSAFLSRKILKAMQLNFTSLIKDDGSVNESVLLDCILSVCDENLLGHEDLQVLFNRPDGENTRKDIRDNLENFLKKNFLKNMMPSLLKDINLKRKRIIPSVDVTLNSEELANLPEECIHTLHFHVSPNNIKLYSEE